MGFLLFLLSLHFLNFPVQTLTIRWCSERMYKHQFKKWNWSKYKSSKDRK